jgi:hypothetical protein
MSKHFHQFIDTWLKGKINVDFSAFDKITFNKAYMKSIFWIY